MAEQVDKAELTVPAFNGLTIALTLATLPHVGHMPWWLGVLFAVAVGWRWRIAIQGLALPGRWLLLIITLAVGTGVFSSYGTLFGRDAGVALLSAMTSLKLLESRTLRDSMVLIFLGYFLVMTNLLYTQSLFIAIYVLVTLVALLAAQLLIHHRHATLPCSVLLRLAVRMLFQSIPIVLVLFILFPRVSGPLWNLSQDAYRGRTGLSDEMSPGAISQLSQTDTVAFRVQFTGTLPSPEQLYWRGPVLWDYDGHTWKSLAEIPRSTFDYTPEGAGMDYTVTLEPHGKRWLFALDLPASLPVETIATTSFELLRAQPVNEVLRYQVRSYPYYRTGELSSWERQRALQLPAQVNPRARTLAAEWRKRDPDSAALVRAALALFRKEPFYYTLTPPLLGKEGVDDFLFNTRQGFCEHYAGSFVFLMRAAGVPARVITGYQGGERNTLNNSLIVRQSDAHAWAEVWLEDWGWVRVDPTAAVAPERVEQGLYAAVANSKTLPFLMGRHNLWIQQLGLGWDALNKAWHKWVLTYGPERQQQFLAGLGFGIGDWRGMAFAMVLALGSLGLVFAGLRTLQRRAAVDPVIQAYQCFCAKLARYGLVRDAHEGPLDFAERVARHHPDLAYQARLISQLYATLRFGRAYQQDSVKRLCRLVKNFKV